MSSDESNFLDESDKLGSDSRSSGTYYFCSFHLRDEESVDGVLGSIVFTPIGVECVSGVFASTILSPTGVESKGGQLLAIFWRSN